MQHRLLELLVGGRDDLYLVGDPAQAIYGFNGSDPGAAARRRRPAARASRSSTCRPTTAARRRSSPPASAVLRAGGQPTRRRVGARRRRGRAHRGRRRRGPRGGARRHVRARRSIPVAVRAGHVAVLARTNAQLPRLGRGARRAPACRCTRRQLAAGLAARRPSCTAVTALPSATRLRGWAHDVLEADDGRRRSDDRRTPSAASPRRCSSSSATSRSATARRCGRGSRRRTRSPSRRRVGVEVLTFHAAKGREWPTVVVTGVETGLVPHRSATTAEARAEEARLLHVAVTRATDRLVLTWAGAARRLPPPAQPADRRHRHRRAPVAAPPPPELRSLPRRRTGAARAAAGVARAGGPRGRGPARPRCARTPTWRPSPRPARRPPPSSPRRRRSAR